MSRAFIKKYLDAKLDRRLFQTRVRIGLLDEVNSVREKDGLSWQELIEALFKLYVDDSKKEKAHGTK